MRERSGPRDRAEAIAWARSLIGDPRTVFLDTETTGLGRGAEVIDLAVVDRSGAILENRLIRPLRPIPPDAIFIHGISNRDVADCEGWMDVASEINALLDGRPIVAYNAPFDRSMIDQCNDEAGCARISGPWHCAMRAFTAYRRDCRDGPRNRGWHSLTVAARTLGFPAPSHRALADAQACRSVVLTMAEQELTS